MTKRQAWRVLVVDDYAAYRETLQQVFAPDSRFIIVGEAANGEEAIQIAAQLHPSLVLMDMRLPDMNGLAAAEIIKRHQPQIIIFILSSDWSPAYERRAKAVGIAARLAKQTFNLEELYRLIKE
jgi:DNA-binding NarL/FixJ family response regulator